MTFANIDGVSTVGAIIDVMDVAGMREDETLATLESLVIFGAVALD